MGEIQSRKNLTIGNGCGLQEVIRMGKEADERANEMLRRHEEDLTAYDKNGNRRDFMDILLEGSKKLNGIFPDGIDLFNGQAR